MTCHCGNCEDHRVDSWKMFDHDSFQWTEAVTDEIKTELFGSRKTPIVVKSDRPSSLAGHLGANPEERTKMAEELETRAEKCYMSVSEEDNTFKVTIRRQGNIIYEQNTGIEVCYLAHLSEDFLVPLRNLLEALGFDVEERYDRV